MKKLVTEWLDDFCTERGWERYHASTILELLIDASVCFTGKHWAQVPVCLANFKTEITEIEFQHLKHYLDSEFKRFQETYHLTIAALCFIAQSDSAKGTKYITVARCERSADELQMPKL